MLAGVELYRKRKRTLGNLVEEGKSDIKKLIEGLKHYGMESFIPIVSALSSDSEEGKALQKALNEGKENPEGFFTQLASDGLAQLIPIFVELVATRDEEFLTAALIYYRMTKKMNIAIEILQCFKIWESEILVDKFNKLIE